jgi:hypothetical protein
MTRFRLGYLNAGHGWGFVHFAYRNSSGLVVSAIYGANPTRIAGQQTGARQRCLVLHPTRLERQPRHLQLFHFTPAVSRRQVLHTHSFATVLAPLGSACKVRYLNKNKIALKVPGEPVRRRPRILRAVNAPKRRFRALESHGYAYAQREAGLAHDITAWEIINAALWPGTFAAFWTLPWP